MNCKNVRELAGAYVYGDLTPEEMKAVRVHTRICSGCEEDIRTQMALIGKIPNSAPVLSDEDRQRIAWTVKGAVMASEPERRTGWFKFSPAYALAAAVIVGMIGVAVNSTMSPTARDNERPTVVITEVPKQETPKQDSGAVEPPDTGDVARTPDIPAETGNWMVEDMNNLRARLPVGTLTHRHRSNNAPIVVPPEPPAPLIEDILVPDVIVGGEEEKLPEPTDVNDARTTPPQETENIDANGTETSETETPGN